jgi:hypothetical protein
MSLAWGETTIEGSHEELWAGQEKRSDGEKEEGRRVAEEGEGSEMGRERRNGRHQRWRRQRGLRGPGEAGTMPEAC